MDMEGLVDPVLGGATKASEVSATKSSEEGLALTEVGQRPIHEARIWKSGGSDAFRSLSSRSDFPPVKGLSTNLSTRDSSSRDLPALRIWHRPSLHFGSGF